MLGWLLSLFPNTTGCAKMLPKIRIPTRRVIEEITIPDSSPLSTEEEYFIPPEVEDSIDPLVDNLTARFELIITKFSEENIAELNMLGRKLTPELAVDQAKLLIQLCNKSPAMMKAYKILYNKYTKIRDSLKPVFDELRKLDPALANYLLSC